MLCIENSVRKSRCVNKLKHSKYLGSSGNLWMGKDIAVRLSETYEEFKVVHEGESTVTVIFNWVGTTQLFSATRELNLIH